MIDLRSDTVTVPSTAMRQAMAQAPVGDDVYGDDPTVAALEERVADLLGKDAAMYVPSGTMSNQIAVRVQTEPGDSVVLEADAHIGTHELGGAALHSGVTLRRITGTRGVFSGDDLRDLVPVPHPSLPGHLYDPHTLVCVENTHNEAGGTVWPMEAIDDVTGAARHLGMRAHLDGARLWNASAATGIPVSTYAAPFDTVSVCFSKGLGAPIGSALVSDSETIARARRFKHMFGGGFRQAGIIAAGALHALEHHRSLLAHDHEHARRFAEAISDTGEADIDLDTVQTNIVYFYVDDPAAIVDASLAHGLAMLKLDDRAIRAVFHLDITEAATATAIDIVTDVLTR